MSLSLVRLKDDLEVSAFDQQSASVIKLNNSTVLYLKEVNKFLALVCILRDDSFERQGQSYSFERQGQSYSFERQGQSYNDNVSPTASSGKVSPTASSDKLSPTASSDKVSFTASSDKVSPAA